MVSEVISIVGVIEKLFLRKFITIALSKNLNVHYEQETLSYDEVEDSPCPKIASKYSLGKKDTDKKNGSIGHIHKAGR